MSEPLVRVVDLAKHFDEGRIRALDGVDLTLDAGEFVAITGRSGCGKSTLLHLLAALDEPTRGSIRVGAYSFGAGHHPRSRTLDRFRRTQVGLVFQLHNLLPQLSVLQNVEIAMMGTGRGGRQCAGEAAALLDEVGLGHRLQSRPPELSGGERQRVAIARSLANQPPLLLADEPTGSLDSESITAVLQLLRALRSTHGLTVVMVTHDSAVAASADRIIEMVDGRIVAASTSTQAPARC
jgi:ABC-type lipoprotein export system ATPase subunit